MPATLCDLALSLPRVVGALLDREARLKRGRFREESITDVLVAALAGFAGPDLIIQYPPEALTGGDVDLEFWNVSSGQRLLLRLQAKRLNAEYHGERKVAVAHRSYQELLHKVASTGAYQYKTISTSTDPHLPLYIFYNHGAVVDDPYYHGKLPRVSGVNLAFAFDVAQELDAKLSALPQRRHHKRLSHLQPLFFGLEEILCPGGSVIAGGVPTPVAISESLGQRWRTDRKLSGTEDDTVRAYRYLFDPIGPALSRDPRSRIPDGPAVRVSDEVERDTVTFISGRTEDERTPRIVDSLQG